MENCMEQYYEEELESNKPKSIKVVDAPPGYGKTHSMIHKIKRASMDDKFIFVTPYLKEIDRVKKEVDTRRFYDPKSYGSKQHDLHKLLKQGKDIATTHSLFQLSTETTKALIRAHEYTLVLDEVMSVIQETDISKDDIEIMLEQKLAHIDENFYLQWDDQTYNGEYNYIKIMANNKTLIVIDNKVLLWKFPVDIFQSFKEVYVLTYMFDAQLQKYYYDIFDIDYEYFMLDKHKSKFIPVDSIPQYKEFKDFVKDNVNLYEGKLNNIGDGKYTLSYTWYNGDKQKMDNKPLIELLKKNLYTYFINNCKTKSKYNMWTSFKANRSNMAGKGYTKGFIPFTTRATNSFNHKESCAYMINRFLKPQYSKFFSQHGLIVDQDLLALSDLIQWIWRSRIREGESINLYIPSERTRNLFKKWLNNEI